MILLDMRLNYKKSTHIVVNDTSIAVQYFFTKDDVCDQPPGSRKVWAVINFRHPHNHGLVRLRVAEPQSILDANHNEVETFVEREVECYINHCDEDEAYRGKNRQADALSR